MKLNRLRLRLRQQKFAQKGTAHTWRIRNRSHDIPKGAAACVCVCVCVYEWVCACPDNIKRNWKYFILHLDRTAHCFELRSHSGTKAVESLSSQYIIR